MREKNRRRGKARGRGPGRSAGDVLAGARRRLLAGDVAGGHALVRRIGSTAGIFEAEERIARTRSVLDLAAIYQWTEDGLEWLAEARERVRQATAGTGRRGLARVELCLSALRARLIFATRDMAEGARFFASSLGALEREGILEEPWAHNFYMAVLIEENRLQEADALLRSCTFPAARATPLDRAIRLHLLGHRLASEGRDGRALTVLRAAESLAAAAGGPEGEFQRALCRAYLARIHADTGEVEEAFVQLLVADRLSLRLRIPRLADTVRLTRAHLQKREGRHGAALQTLLEARPLPGPPPDPANSDSYRLHVDALGLLNAAWIAVRAGRLSLAERLLENAAPVAANTSSYRLQAFLHVVRGDLAAARAPRPGQRVEEARLEYRAAEEILTRRGLRDTNIRLLLGLGEGWLAYREGDMRTAVHHALTSMKLARERRAADVEAQGLLLQSVLLLEDSTPQHRLYDGILPRLGAIRDSVCLFKVVANLYLYAYEYTRDMELVDLHMKQIHGLRSRLEPELFRELYRIHVAQPIFDRLGRDMLGG